jgi:small subunit ribosomal protein S17
MNEQNDNAIKRKHRKTRTGLVVSACQKNTVIVQVETRSPHPLYKKVVRTSKKYYAHDENNEAKEGDMITIMECRPYSKLKRWRFVKVVSRLDQKKLENEILT